MPRILLKPNDILLYKPASFFGRLISIKTWHAISHVEVYKGIDESGDRCSYASRDGIGVGKYPLRLTDLVYILRPHKYLDRVAGDQFFQRLEGTPYGWMDLLNFIGVPVDRKGIVCSAFVAGYLRAEGWDVFRTDNINKVAPFQFLDLVGDGDDCCSIVYDFSHGMFV